MTRFLNWLLALLGWNPKPPPRDPYADRLAPVRRGPRNRSGAAAVEEPNEEH